LTIAQFWNRATARTGKSGDGKIFRSRIDKVIRIRNDDCGADAI
jgi:nitrogen regulatory protein PII